MINHSTCLSSSPLSPCAAKLCPTSSDPPEQCQPFLPVKGLVDELSDVHIGSFFDSIGPSLSWSNSKPRPLHHAEQDLALHAVGSNQVSEVLKL